MFGAFSILQVHKSCLLQNVKGNTHQMFKKTKVTDCDILKYIDSAVKHSHHTLSGFPLLCITLFYAIARLCWNENILVSYIYVF